VNTNPAALLLRHGLILLGAALLLGLLSGAWGWSLALCLAAYLAWVLRDLLRLQRWLESATPRDEVPEARGLWEALYDRIYLLQRRNRESRERLQAVIDRAQQSTAALQDAVVMLDRDGNLEWWNPAGSRLLGLQTPQDSGQPVINLVRHPRFKEYFERKDFREPLSLRSPVDANLHLQIFITLYGQRDHLMVVRDVTRMQQLEQMRKDFVANVSHELRTPLTVISGYLETLLDHDAPAPRWQRPMQQMQQQATRMSHLLDDLLLLARLEATDYPAESQPVAIERVLQMIRADALALSGTRGHRVELEIEAGLLLKGCDSELRSAFSNLVFNAVKYTPDGGDVRVRWWSDEQGAHLAVRDNGLGIEAKHLPRLTERFYRVDASRAADTGGTGLGLAIVKHVLLRHRGRLEIVSQPGQGSTFTCHFPTTLCVRYAAQGATD
jgi:two-component system phosphate regulon sensor histidine kinase PhoR